MNRLLAVTVVCLITACSTSRQAQLERVAKDWSETIRASQIIPVYPLTEDLHPGDIFLVQLTVDEQHKAYEGAGFLPFDNHIARIYPTGYKRFYQGSFAIGDETKPIPKYWLTSDSIWKDSPTAAFPTYSFTTSRGGSLSLALPINGIPVGISLLGAKSAVGTVAINDARTYGVDTYSLNLDVRAWADRHRDFLSQFGSKVPDGGKNSNDSKAPPNYLRVVSRVYLTGRVNISLQASETFSAGVSAGVPTPAELLTAKTGKTSEEVEEAATDSYASAIAKLNETISSVRDEGVGGTLKVVAASARSISLEETFERPLIIGYLGFDMQILEGGRLGTPIPTHKVLERGVAPPADQVFFTADQAAYDRALRKAKNKSADFYSEILRRLDPALANNFNQGNRTYTEFKKVLGTWRREPDDQDQASKNLRMHDATHVITEQLNREGG